MSDRKPYSREATAETEFSEFSVERFSSDHDRARSHAIGRNRRLGQCLCMLGLMRAHGLIPPLTRCKVTAADWQDLSCQAGDEAAHYMPGQLKLVLPGKSEVDPWSPLRDPRTRNEMGKLFSRVQGLSANFNKADSYAEHHARPSLKELFASTCQHVVDAPPPKAGVLNRNALQASYQHWIAQSTLAYRSAINRKIDIAELDDLPPATSSEGFEPHQLNTDLPDLLERAVRKNAKGESTATVWDYSEQTRVLGHYILANVGSTLSDAFINDVVANFKP